jgi:hypothetical protein
LNIHNWCQSINLTSPVYFIHGGKWNVAPNQKIYVNAVIQNRLEFDVGQDILEGALVYRLQRKRAKSTRDESEHNWLLVVWNGEHRKGLHIHALVIEHNKRLDEDKLRELYQKHWSLLKARANATGGSWTLNDATKLSTTIEVTNGGYRWDVFISEERK